MSEKRHNKLLKKLSLLLSLALVAALLGSVVGGGATKASASGVDDTRIVDEYGARVAITCPNGGHTIYQEHSGKRWNSVQYCFNASKFKLQYDWRCVDVRYPGSTKYYTYRAKPGHYFKVKSHMTIYADAYTKHRCGKKPWLGAHLVRVG